VTAVTVRAVGDLFLNTGCQTVCWAAASDIQDGKCHDRICWQSRWVMWQAVGFSSPL